MFITAIIAQAIAVLLLITISFFGILQYKENSQDDDADTTFNYLKIILAGLSLVIILSLCIMAYSHYNIERKDAGIIQTESH